MDNTITEFVFNDQQMKMQLAPGATVQQVIPEVAAAFGLLDASVSFEGYKLVDLSGYELLPNSQVPNNTIIRIIPNALDKKQKKYDDVTELVGDLAVDNVTAWTSAGTEQSVLLISCLMMIVAAITFAFNSEHLIAGLGSLTFGIILAALSLILRKKPRFRLAPLIFSLVYCAFFGIGGLQLASLLDVSLHLDPMLFAGVGVLVGAGVMLIFLKKDRIYALTPAVFGGVTLATSGIEYFASYGIVVAATVVVLSLIVAFLPRIALSTARVKLQMPVSDQTLFDDPEPIDTDAIKQQTIRASKRLSALNLGICLTELSFIPYLCSQKNAFGLALIVCAFTLNAFISRRYYARRDCSILVISAISAIVMAVYVTNNFHPDWQIPLTIVVLVSASLSMVFVLFGFNRKYSPARHTFMSVLELATTTAIIPLALLTSGII